jgi:hypothetical protein
VNNDVNQVEVYQIAVAEFMIEGKGYYRNGSSVPESCVKKSYNAGKREVLQVHAFFEHEGMKIIKNRRRGKSIRINGKYYDNKGAGEQPSYAGFRSPGRLRSHSCSSLDAK